MIDKYKPDVLWFDGGAQGAASEQILAHYFKHGALKPAKRSASTTRATSGITLACIPLKTAPFDPKFVEWPWEDDTPSAVGWCDWPWWWGLEYKKPRDVVVRLVDLVVRNGGLLLSLNPRPDGTLDQGQIDLLVGIGGWLNRTVNPFTAHGRGSPMRKGMSNVCPWFKFTLLLSQRNTRSSRTPEFDESDIRFVTKGNTLYATQLVPPSHGDRDSIARSTDSAVGCQQDHDGRIAGPWPGKVHTQIRPS